jgi:hypothetical protein
VEAASFLEPNLYLLTHMTRFDPVRGEVFVAQNDMLCSGREMDVEKSKQLSLSFTQSIIKADLLFLENVLIMLLLEEFLFFKRLHCF